MVQVRQVIIEVRDLSHRYMQGTPLEVSSLTDINMEVHADESVGIIGPAGAGKSTLLHHLNGLLRPVKGDVLVEGVSVFGATVDIVAIRRRVGLVFQNPENQLFEQYAGDDVAFGPSNLNLPREEVRKRVRRAMEMVGLPFSFKDRLTQSLSLGEKRRLALAGVLAMEPKVLVLDEPTGSLDPEGRRGLLRILRKWRSSGRRAVVIASHSMDDIVELSDRVYVLVGGRVVMEGQVRDVFSQPETISRYGLSIPAGGEVMHRLAEMGYPVSRGVLSAEEAADEIMSLLGSWRRF